MVERDGRLNQTLMKTPVYIRAIVPKFFPDIVSLEEVAIVEQANPGQIAGVVIQGVFHEIILSRSVAAARETVERN